jgi:hypothetical protein
VPRLEKLQHKMANHEISVYAVDSLPYGSSYLEWTIRWWRWLLTIPKVLNPSLDVTGTRASINQTDRQVFFLCQTFGNHSLVPKRQIEISYACAIFMPILNWISVSPLDGIGEDQLLKTAKTKIDVVENLSLRVNGKPLQLRLRDYRITSRSFEVNMPSDNLLDLEEGTATCLSDGYWLMFEPETKHLELSSFGSCSSGANKIGISYTISFR